MKSTRKPSQSLGPNVMRRGTRPFVWMLVCWFAILGVDRLTRADEPTDAVSVWSLRPLTRPDIPADQGAWSNPIDAFLARTHRQRGLKPLGPADKRTLLRRVSLDLVGLPPSLEEQQAFLTDQGDSAYEAVVARLLDSPQHGVRYARHWLDIMRYADVDENMPAREQLHLWRDWVIAALNEDLPYDEFVRAQITGYRSAQRTEISATGYRDRVAPRPDDVFALGFLSRGATGRDNGDHALALSAVETISSAFMGMTVGCAKCHDHFYDPIEQADFYAMKALFDPLVLEPVQLATAQQLFEQGRKLTAYERDKRKLERELEAVTAPFHSRLYNERVEMLPPEVRAVIRKPPEQRSADEQQVADDYYPILRIDPPKLREIMPEDVARQYDQLRKEIAKLVKPAELPVFWTVSEDEIRRQQPHYVLNSGDPNRPEKDRPVEPGFPFAPPEVVKFPEGLREGFVDWLTGPENPLFARLVVHRIWQWHFGQGLHAHPNDFGTLGDAPLHPELLDWLAAEFIDHGYSMKWLHRTIVTSDAYRRASAEPVEASHPAANARGRQAENQQVDSANRFFWKFPVQRLAAEPIWDSIHQSAGDLDLTVGGPSFRPNAASNDAKQRRAVYMTRGFRSTQEITPEFLRVFDVEDGRVPCPLRQQSVTAPQSLLLLNSPLLDHAAAKLAQRISEQTQGDLPAAVSMAYELTLCRPPTETESAAAISYLAGDAARLHGLCWLMFNLDEFLYVP